MAATAAAARLVGASAPHQESKRLGAAHGNVWESDRPRTSFLSQRASPVSLSGVHNSTLLSPSLYLQHQRRSFSYAPPRRPAGNLSEQTGRGGLTPAQVLDYLGTHNVAVQSARTSASHVILRECPLCPKTTHDKADNLYKCYIRHGHGGGAYFCHRCGAGGSWYDLKRALGDFAVDSISQVTAQQQRQPQPPRAAAGPSASQGTQGWRSSNSASYTYTPAASAAAAPTQSSPNRFQKRSYEDYLKPLGQNARQVDPLPMPAQRLQALYSTTLLDGPNPVVLDYLKKERGLQVRTLRKYGVGQGSYQFATEKNDCKAADCVTFPWIMSLAQVERQESMRGSTFVSPDESSRTQSTSAAATEPADATDDSKDPDNKESTTPALLSKDSTFVTRRIKVRAAENKAWQRMDPPGGGWGLFGWHTIPADAKEIVLTEGEYDAMAVYQATGRPAVSLPNGARSLPVEVLPMLEQMEKIYLWMDNDAAGQEGAESFAHKLGIDRTYIVRPTVGNTHRLDPTAAVDEPIVLPKDANEALLKGLDMDGIIKTSKVIAHESIMMFENLREDVLHEILYPEKYVGTPISSMPGLTDLMQGLRRGELTVLTGATGSGKTTFLGQLSLDLAEQDVNVLWGSFEIKNTRLLHKLLQQFAREPLPSGDASLTNKMNAIADRFQQLPMYFMTFHGGSDVDQVLEAMDYAGTYLVPLRDICKSIVHRLLFLTILFCLQCMSTTSSTLSWTICSSWFLARA
jgi:twinkle protein